MDLEIATTRGGQHDDRCNACTWTVDHTLLSVGDDGKILQWNHDGECIATIATDLQYNVTRIIALPSAGGTKSDMFATASTDGYLRLMHMNGREEKAVQVSDGVAVIDIDCSSDGNALVTGAEDGNVKLWSRNGMLRSAIAVADKPIYVTRWGPSDQHILYAAGGELRIVATENDKRNMTWKAHGGVVLSADWNSVTNLIVSGGEDRTYRVWDRFGRQLFSSRPMDHVITSVRWNVSGAAFAVGSYNTLCVCDKMGWVYTRKSPPVGSIESLEWSTDGTQLAGAGADDSVVLAHVIGRKASWEQWECTVIAPLNIRVRDVVNNNTEILDFRDRISEVRVGYEHLVVATANQIYLYRTTNWHTPHIFDTRGPVSLIVLAEKHFLTVEATSGIQIYKYDGRPLATIKFPGLRVQAITNQTISLSPDCVAIVDTNDKKTVRPFDVRTGRPVGSKYTHSTEITSLSLSQSRTGLPDRKVAIVDGGQDLWLYPISNPSPTKLRGMVDSVSWCQKADILAALADEQLIQWICPHAAMVDADLLDKTKVTSSMAMAGKRPIIEQFDASRIHIRRADGALVSALVAIAPVMMHQYVFAGRWESAVRLCRFLKQESLWASLATLALAAKQLETAELSLAALNEPAKALYIGKIKSLPSPEVRAAELALLRKKTEESENILLQANPPFVYRAIKMNIRLFRWERALQLARQYNTHLDTVVAYRRRHLQQTKRQEHLPEFQNLSNMNIDWSTIKANKEREKQMEAQRAQTNSSQAQSHNTYEEDGKALD